MVIIVINNNNNSFKILRALQSRCIVLKCTIPNSCFCVNICDNVQRRPLSPDAKRAYGDTEKTVFIWDKQEENKSSISGIKPKELK